MGLRTTLLLLVVVAALGAALWWTDEKPKTNKAVEIAALDGRSLGECKRMWWQFADVQPIELTRDANGGFSMSEPFVDIASVAHVRQIMTAWDTAQLIATEFADDGKGRQETGLQTPVLVFRVEWPDGKVIQYDIGAPGPLGTDRFLRREGRIYRGGNGLHESMAVGLDDMRERAVFRIMEPQCLELEVEQLQETGKRETLHLQRREREWRLVAPLDSRTDAVAAIQFVTAVLSLRVDHFLPGVMRPPARPPDLRIVVRGAAGEQVAQLWQEQGQVFGMIPGRSVAFNSENRQYGEIFQNRAQALRATILLPIGNLVERLGEVVIDPGQGRGDRVRLVRSTFADAWRLEEPVATRASATPINEMISALNSLRVLEFVDGGKADEPRFGLGPGRLQVTVRELDKKELTTLWLGAAEQKRDIAIVYACRADEAASIALVPQPAVEQLRRAWTAYCELDILRLSVSIERLVLRRGTTTRIFRSNGAHWVLDGAEGNRDEVGGFANDDLRDLRGKAAVDLRNDAYGQPDWLLELCRENGDVLMSLRVFDRSKEAPLVVQPWSAETKIGDIGFEVAPHVGKALRELWQ